MNESRKRAVPTANAKNMSSSLDDDFGNDFLSSWKLPKSGADAIDFNVESVPKSNKKFSFESLDDFGLDGAFDKLPSFKMGMSDLDFSSPLKKKVKHNSSNGDDLSEGKKETEKDSFSFNFDFNELGQFNLDAKLGIEDKSTSRVSGKTDPISSGGNKDTQRGLLAKDADVPEGNNSKEQGTDVHEDNNSKEQRQTQDMRPHLTRQESAKNGSHLISNVNVADSSDEMQGHTSVDPARMEQTNVDPMSDDIHEDNSKEAYSIKAAVSKSPQNFSCNAASVEDPTKVPADPVNSKEASTVDFSKVHMSRESNDNEKSISSQSRNTSTVNPYVSRRSVSKLDSQNELMEESTSLNEGSQGNQSFSGTPKKLLKKTSRMTKNLEEGTSTPKSLSSSMRREVRNVKPAQVNETGSFSLAKSANMKASRIELTSETTLNQLADEIKVTKKTTAHPTDLKRWQVEHKQANAGPDKSTTTLSKTHSKPALHGLLTTSMSVRSDKNAELGLEPPSAGNLSILNARNSSAHSTGQKIVPNHALLRSSNASDSSQGIPSKYDKAPRIIPSKDDKAPRISQLTGARIAKLGIRSPKSDMLLEKESVEVSGSHGSLVTTPKILNSAHKGKPALLSASTAQKFPKESMLDPKDPTVVKHIMRSPALRKSPRTVQELGNQTESMLDPKDPTVVKHIMRSPALRKSPRTIPELGNQTILRSGAPNACVDLMISSTPCEMGDISDLELPALLEHDGNVERAEACRKELEDICILLKRKHAEAKELAVRAIVNSNMMLMLNHPMFEEKKFVNGLRLKKYLFEEVGTIDAFSSTDMTLR
ncbi:hypothetical protein ACP70R_036768 [Stipagrostis hirtigluma subsp. patula]